MTANPAFKVFFVLVLIATLGQVVGSLYVPSFSAMAFAFKSPISEVQLTFSVFLLSFGISHLFYGPLSDATGRKIPLIIGIGLCALGCLSCYFASTIEQVLLGRCIQGAGVGVCGAVGRSVSRDLVGGNQLAHLNSRLGMCTAMMLAFAPVLGGYMQEYGGWRFSFLFMFYYVLLVIVLIVFFLPETHVRAKRSDFSLQTAIQNYAALLSSRVFLGYTLTSCFSYAGFIAFITASPILFMSSLGLSAVKFGWLAFAIGASFFIAAYMNSKLILKFGIRAMLFCGVLGMLGFALLLLFGMHHASVYVPVILLLLYSISAGFAFVNAFAGAMHSFPHIAGAAGALFGSLQTLSGAGAAGVISFFQANTAGLLGFFLFVFAIGTGLSFILMVPKKLSVANFDIAQNN